MTDSRRRPTILVVDDDADIRRIASRLLEIAGYTAITAADGEDGFRLYQQHRPGIALLLTDVVMPNLNGIELAKRVLGMDSELPVLLMSGNTGSDYRDLECLAKPFRPAELIEAVSRVLSGKAKVYKAASAF
jgi:two-component system, cell cycle sensor histidine kinase and response regulator CckA